MMAWVLCDVNWVVCFERGTNNNHILQERQNECFHSRSLSKNYCLFKQRIDIYIYEAHDVSAHCLDEECDLSPSQN